MKWFAVVAFAEEAEIFSATTCQSTAVLLISIQKEYKSFILYLTVSGSLP